VAEIAAATQIGSPAAILEIDKELKGLGVAPDEFEAPKPDDKPQQRVVAIKQR